MCTMGFVAESLTREAAFALGVWEAAAAPTTPAVDGGCGIGLSVEEDFPTTPSTQDDGACTRCCSNRFVRAGKCASARRC